MAKDNPSDLIRAKDVSLFDRWSLPSFDPQGEEEELPSAPSVEKRSKSWRVARTCRSRKSNR